MEDLHRAHLGTVLQDSRRQMRKTPSDISQTLGVPESHVTQIEQGDIPVDVCRIALRDAYGLADRVFDQYFMATHKVTTFETSAGPLQRISPKTKSIWTPESQEAAAFYRGGKRVSYFATQEFLL